MVTIKIGAIHGDNKNLVTFTVKKNLVTFMVTKNKNGDIHGEKNLVTFMVTIKIGDIHGDNKKW